MGAMVVFTSAASTACRCSPLLYGLNMYFQSFGAVSIVKVNAAWFHVRERGTFGGIFGILISLGVYFALRLVPLIARVPAETRSGCSSSPPRSCVVFAVLCFMFVRDTPVRGRLRGLRPRDDASADGGRRRSACAPR
jgi:OPA family glycerol-3-phosphate transporter-like MFS transporter